MEDITKITGLRKAPNAEKIEKYQDLDANAKELLIAAHTVRLRAYVPYSNFKVGAAFRTKCGRIFTGCNIENAAFTPTACAERTALCKGISEGYLEFIAGAVSAYQEDAFTTPCGVCRQFIMEFSAEDMPLYITKAVEQPTAAEGVSANLENAPEDLVLCSSIYNLLPNGFRNFK